MQTLFTILALGLVCSLTCAAQKDEGLVAYYTFDEGSGSIAHDSSGNGNDGQIQGAKWVGLKKGCALEFDGLDDYVDCGSDESLNITEKITVEAWVYYQGAPLAVTSIVSKGPGYSLYACSGWYFYWCHKCQTAPLLIPDFWHHLVGTFDGATFKVYLDDALIYVRSSEEVGLATLASAVDESLFIGKGYFEGMIDEVKVYSRALSAEEIDAHYQEGRLVHNVPIKLYPYYFNQQVVAQIDPVAWGTLAAAAAMEVELAQPGQKRPLHTRRVELSPDGEPMEAELRVGELDPGQYAVRVTPIDSSGAPVGETYVARLDWPDRPSWSGAGKKASVLNNFVTELLNVQRQGSQLPREHEFTNPREGWIFISSTADLVGTDKVRISLDTDPGEDTLIVHNQGQEPIQEAMRFLPAGQYRLRVWAQGKSSLAKLIVRTTPEFVLNQEWNLQGKRNIRGCHLPGRGTGAVSVEEVYGAWAKALRDPTVDGIAVDEFPGRGHNYPAWTEALRRIHDDERFKDKTLYAYTYAPPFAYEVCKPFFQTMMDCGYKIAWERYLCESPTKMAARRFVTASFKELTLAAEQNLPGCTKHTQMCLSLFTAHPLTVDTNPGVDYKVYLDMQYHHLANDPVFWDLDGFIPFGAGLADEEVLRWHARLYRHYCIEGKTEMLSPYPYELTYIENADFAQGLQGWTVSPAEEGSIEGKTMPGYDRVVQGGWYRATLGDSFLWMKKSKSAPNTVAQKLTGLEPGRLYSLKMYTLDYQHPQVEQELAISIKLTPVELLPEKCFQRVYRTYRSKAPEQKDWDWANYHRLVFRAQDTEAILEISDWTREESKEFSSGTGSHESLGVPLGQEITSNFIQIQPYLED